MIKKSDIAHDTKETIYDHNLKAPENQVDLTSIIKNNMGNCVYTFDFDDTIIRLKHEFKGIGITDYVPHTLEEMIKIKNNNCIVYVVTARDFGVEEYAMGANVIKNLSNKPYVSNGREYKLVEKFYSPRLVYFNDNGKRVGSIFVKTTGLIDGIFYTSNFDPSEFPGYTFPSDSKGSLLDQIGTQGHYDDSEVVVKSVPSHIPTYDPRNMNERWNNVAASYKRRRWYK